MKPLRLLQTSDDFVLDLQKSISNLFFNKPFTQAQINFE